jgi:hypothetical protein
VGADVDVDRAGGRGERGGQRSGARRQADVLIGRTAAGELRRHRDRDQDQDADQGGDPEHFRSQPGGDFSTGDQSYGAETGHF